MARVLSYLPLNEATWRPQQPQRFKRPWTFCPRTLLETCCFRRSIALYSQTLLLLRFETRTDPETDNRIHVWCVPKIPPRARPRVHKINCALSATKPLNCLLFKQSVTHAGRRCITCYTCRPSINRLNCESFVLYTFQGWPVYYER